MKVSRDWLINFSFAEEKLRESEDSLDVIPPGLYGYVKRLLLQTKLVSQLVARSWVNDDIGKKLMDYFLTPYDEKSVDGKLKTLLGANLAPYESDDSQEAALLRPLFSYNPNLLPIFDAGELKVYRFTVTVNVFEGALNELPGTEFREGPWFEMVIPYPPKPNEIYVSEQDLKDWVKDPALMPNRDLKSMEKEPFLLGLPIYPPSPYIPSTCC